MRGHRRAEEGKEAGKWTFPMKRIDVSTGHDLVDAGLRLRAARSLPAITRPDLLCQRCDFGLRPESSLSVALRFPRRERDAKKD